jgi:hypothetical protein
MKRLFILAVSLLLCISLLVSCGSTVTFKDNKDYPLTIEKCVCMFEEHKGGGAGFLEPVYVQISMEKERAETYLQSPGAYNSLVYITAGSDGDYKMYLKGISEVIPSPSKDKALIALKFLVPSGDSWTKSNASEYFNTTKLTLYWATWDKNAKEIHPDTVEHMKIDLPTAEVR